MTDELKNFQRDISTAIREGHEPPPADVIDEDKYIALVTAGNNKLRLKICTTCGKPPTSLVGTIYKERGLPDEIFMFVDDLSAREYQISGMCQDCQDSVFNQTEDDL